MKLRVSHFLKQQKLEVLFCKLRDQRENKGKIIL